MRGVADEAATAFDAFVVRRYGSLARFGYLLTGNRAAGEDLVQTALFKTYLRWHRMHERDDPVAYVRKAMVNTHISWTRRLASRELLFADPPEQVLLDESPGDLLDLWQALPSLPPRMRAVLVLRFYEDLTEIATAQVLGCSTGTVKSQTSRGLARLRQVLAEADRPHDEVFASVRTQTREENPR